MEAKLKNASFESKGTQSLPKGAKILKKGFTITVEEIENGFVLRKSYDIKYQLGDDTGYEYYTKKWFSKDNPLQIDESAMEESTLADNFED